jgi:BirA family biotin operon repressor/biotin-[acetyl-CoA-carboxylase] ligase
VEHSPIGLEGDFIRTALQELPLGGLRVFRSLGSTNDEALEWAAHGARDLSVVISDEQTAGRGRAGRRWHTPSGAALALSVVLRPDDGKPPISGRLAGLGALAVAEACQKIGLPGVIKWPNDVLIQRRKVAGVLVETQWSGQKPEASILGIGINVSRGSIPTVAELSFPATTIEEEMGALPNRVQILRDVLSSLVVWRDRVHTAAFLRGWDSLLAFRGERVSLMREGAAGLTGTVLGLASDGELRLQTEGEELRVAVGDLHLFPSDDRID